VKAAVLAAVVALVPACTDGSDHGDIEPPPLPPLGWQPGPCLSLPPAPDEPRRYEVAVAGYDVGGVPGREDESLFLGTLDGARRRIFGPCAEVNHVAVSPDGARVAFAAREASWTVRVLDLADGSSRVVGYGELLRPPVWSPDGTQLLVEWEVHAVRMQSRISFEGAEPEMIAYRFDEGCGGASWSPDGRELALAAADTIRVHTLATGENRVVARYAREACAPVWSPDGRHIAFARDGRTRGSGFSLADPAAGPLLALHDVLGDIVGPPTWSPDGQSLVFFEHEPIGDTYLLRRLGIDRSLAATLSEVGGLGGDVELSAEGDRVLYRRTTDRTVLVVWDAATGAAADLPGPERESPRSATWLPVPVDGQ
jgi:hypothetical protein